MYSPDVLWLSIKSHTVNSVTPRSDADYSKVDTADCAAELDHPSANEKQMLCRALQACPTLFGGGLGQPNVKPVHLELKEGAKPYHGGSFPTPKAYETTTKTEIKWLCGLGVLERNHNQ